MLTSTSGTSTFRRAILTDNGGFSKPPDGWPRLPPIFLASLAGVYEDLGLYDKAIAAYLEALKMASDDKNSIHELGILYLIRGDKKKAAQLIPGLMKLDQGLC